MKEMIIAGNWKMNTDPASAQTLARGVVQGVAASGTGATVVVCPPFISLDLVHKIISGSRVRLGAQHLHFENDGAFTGEISAAMLKSVGCEFVIIGHSERRQLFGETDATVNKRLQKAVQHGLRPIVCVGETLEERVADVTFAILHHQLRGAFENVDQSSLAQFVIAYEPVWAIGTGRNATPDQVETVHAFIRATVAEIFSQEIAANVSVLYGGSVKPENAAEIFSQPDVDGGLIGGASLKADSFCAIVEACR